MQIGRETANLGRVISTLPEDDDVFFTRCICSLAIALGLAAAGFLRADDPPKPPVKLTAQEDHKRMMELLHIKELRRGADGNPKSARAANLDESKANPYPDLPDPLTCKDGTKVTSPEQWRKRRAEIVEDFDREIYGRVPRETPKVNWEVTATEKQMVGEVPVVIKRLVGHVDNSSYPLVTVNIQLTLTTPEKAAGPVPVIMEFGFSFPAGKGPKRPAFPKGKGPAQPSLATAGAGEGLGLRDHRSQQHPGR